MDTTYQDIHICNRKQKKEIVYRQLRINKIVFEREMVYVFYKDHNNVDMTMGFPKQRGISITID